MLLFSYSRMYLNPEETPGQNNKTKIIYVSASQRLNNSEAVSPRRIHNKVDNVIVGVIGAIKHPQRSIAVSETWGREFKTLYYFSEPFPNGAPEVLAGQHIAVLEIKLIVLTLNRYQLILDTSDLLGRS